MNAPLTRHAMHRVQQDAERDDLLRRSHRLAEIEQAMDARGWGGAANDRDIGQILDDLDRLQRSDYRKRMD